MRLVFTLSATIHFIEGLNMSVRRENWIAGDNIIAQLGETEMPGNALAATAWGMGWDGTAGNQPRGTIIKNNFAYRCGLFEKQSSFYFQAKSCKNVISNNIFFVRHCLQSSDISSKPK
eukprot:SAG31_NODE_6744_length_1903_cov_1.449557_2_plen_118_part_00